MKKIITAPNSILKIPSQPVTKIDTRISNLAQDLINTLENKGLGLAAPQIGKSQTVFAIKLPREKPTIFINPIIISHSAQKQYFQLVDDHDHHQEPFKEGCLSLPHLWGTVKRWPKITVCWLNLKEEEEEKELSNLEAIIFQHELDHLEGILFPQRITEDGGKLYQEEEGELKLISSQKD